MIQKLLKDPVIQECVLRKSASELDELVKSQVSTKNALHVRIWAMGTHTYMYIIVVSIIWFI